MYRDPAGRMQEFTGRSQRVDPLHDAVLDDGTEEVLARLRAEFQYAPTEEKHDFFGTLARSPDVCRAYLELGTALAVTGTLPARERELVILRSAVIEGDVHYDALTIEQGAQVEGRFAHDTVKSTAKSAAPAAPEDKGADNGDGGEPRLTLAG